MLIIINNLLEIIYFISCYAKYLYPVIWCFFWLKQWDGCVTAWSRDVCMLKWKRFSYTEPGGVEVLFLSASAMTSFGRGQLWVTHKYRTQHNDGYLQIQHNSWLAIRFFVSSWDGALISKGITEWSKLFLFSCWEHKPGAILETDK